MKTEIRNRFAILPRNALFFVFFFVAITASSTVCGWQSLPNFEFKDGPLHEFSDEISYLVRLKWDGRNIKLSLEWPEIDAEEIQEKQIQKFIDRGQNREMAARFALRRVGRLGDSEQHPLLNAFLALAQQNGRGRSGGGGGDNWRYRFSTELIGAACQIQGESIRIEFMELGDNTQQFVLNDPTDKRISVVFFSDDLIIDFRQKADGQVRVAVIDDEPRLFTAADYESLVIGHPEVMQNLLHPWFTHMGIIAPYTIFSPEIYKAMLTQLSAMADEDRTEIRKLVEALESAGSKERAEILQRLADGFESWESSIKHFASEESLTAESRQALTQLIENSNQNEARKLIEKNDLMNSPEIFVEMLTGQTTDEKSLILGHLKSLTGQDFGDSPKRWKEWLRER